MSDSRARPVVGAVFAEHPVVDDVDELPHHDDGREVEPDLDDPTAELAAQDDHAAFLLSRFRGFTFCMAWL